jgi:hypothetical protein
MPPHRIGKKSNRKSLPFNLGRPLIGVSARAVKTPGGGFVLTVIPMNIGISSFSSFGKARLPRAGKSQAYLRTKIRSVPLCHSAFPTRK